MLEHLSRLVPLGLVVASFACTTAVALEPETQGASIYTRTGVYHGVSGNHEIWECYDYPLNWPEVYQEMEDLPANESDMSDAWDESHEGSVLARRNFASTPDYAITTVTGTASVTVELSGQSTSSTTAALGWPTVGTLTAGGTTSIGWQVSGTFTGQTSLQIGYPMWPGIAPNTAVFYHPYHYTAHRKGREYDQVRGVPVLRNPSD